MTGEGAARRLGQAKRRPNTLMPPGLVLGYCCRLSPTYPHSRPAQSGNAGVPLEPHARSRARPTQLGEVRCGQSRAALTSPCRTGLR